MKNKEICVEHNQKKIDFDNKEEIENIIQDYEEEIRYLKQYIKELETQKDEEDIDSQIDELLIFGKGV